MTQTDRILTFSDCFVISCGTVCLDLNQRAVLILRHRGKNQFYFPKGRKNRGETLEDAAVRETYEESGYPCQLLQHNCLSTKAPCPNQDKRSLDSLLDKNVGEKNELHTEPFAVQQWVYQDGVRKLIFWFLATADSLQPPHENTQDEGEEKDNFEAHWINIEGALAMLTFEDDRELIRKALEVLKLSKT
ncbi:NUDIX hydrolase domain-like protein [Talaromyces proteolyticus]|uniref:NUDIX hydrolase domain-like protein n=1 Tax=Talaromyces proteolyticus TaxID=1131652 RepID=A0AAD4PSS4_9EURO|nr:NUDIX hydrolase domain-like protein [Talaromyces proteolyticus]KAH8691961.1 NUDIX hydrolase domain-like protein [Talaromyces proteolyticus]